ncbi:acetyltransferase [Sporosarcina sp. FSL K6-1522]|uniref:acetyltransferase n=1 Tax=Sporosarcina sp. FSL K6-1522 TaxID=2921554 RepID=UPI00315B173F
MCNFAQEWIESRKDNKIIIIGAGSLGKMTASILADNNDYDLNNIAFLDDNIMPGQKILDFMVIGKPVDLEGIDCDGESVDFVIGIANNKIRRIVADTFGNFNYVNVIHKTASISKYANLGYGNIILPHVSIDPDAVIENHVIINKNSTIGHNVTLRDYSQACPGTNLGGDIGKGVFLGLGSTVLPGIRVGENSVIGAGAVVNKDIPANCVAVGIPCKPVKSID